MASYQTGTASSPVDLVQKLATWLVAQGWTQDMSQADGAGWRWHGHKGGDYVHIKACMNQSPYTNASTGYGVACYLGTGFNAANAWSNQVGGPLAVSNATTIGAVAQLPSGAIIAYHFFDDGADNMLIAIERSSSLFTHFGFGRSLIKAGSWTGGAYCFGGCAITELSQTSASGIPGLSANARAPFYTDSSYNVYPMSFIRADIEGETGKWVSTTETTSTSYYTGLRCATGLGTSVVTAIPHYSYFGGRPVNLINTSLHLLPIYVLAERPSGGHSHLGKVPNIYFNENNVGSGYTAGQIVPYAGDNYMVFPNFLIKKLA